MNHNEWLEKAEIYALGALDGEELAQFEAHLASGCRACEEHLRETRQSLTLLPRSLTPLDPAPEIKAKLTRQISAEAAGSGGERVRFKWLWWGVGAGALATAVLLITLSWSLYATRQELQRIEGRITALRTVVAEQEEILRFLSDPQVRLIHLSGLPTSPGAAGRLLWNPTARTGLLLASGLPLTPPDRSYELWAIAGDEPVPAGVFKVEQGGRVIFRLPPLIEGKSFDKFAVSLEPAAGVPKPTGPMHLIGNL